MISVSLIGILVAFICFEPFLAEPLKDCKQAPSIDADYTEEYEKHNPWIIYISNMHEQNCTDFQYYGSKTYTETGIGIMRKEFGEGEVEQTYVITRVDPEYYTAAAVYGATDEKIPIISPRIPSKSANQGDWNCCYTCTADGVYADMFQCFISVDALTKENIEEVKANTKLFFETYKAVEGLEQQVVDTYENCPNKPPVK